MSAATFRRQPPVDAPRRPARQPRVDGKRRRKRFVENDAFRGFLSRILASLAQRVGSGDADDLHLMASVVADAEALLRRAVADQRARGDVSWSQLGAALGVSKQAAFKRFGGAARPSAGGDDMSP